MLSFRKEVNPVYTLSHNQLKLVVNTVCGRCQDPGAVPIISTRPTEKLNWYRCDRSVTRFFCKLSIIDEQLICIKQETGTGKCKRDYRKSTETGIEEKNL